MNEARVTFIPLEHLKEEGFYTGSILISGLKTFRHQNLKMMILFLKKYMA